MQPVLATLPPLTAAGRAMHVGRPSNAGWTPTPARPAASSRSITRPRRPDRSAVARCRSIPSWHAPVGAPCRHDGRWYTRRPMEAPMHRLTTWTLGFALSIVLAGVAPAMGQTPPLFETKKITDTVYLFRYGGHQAIFVVTPAGVIATDPIAYLRPQAATTYIDEIRKVTPAPIKYVVYSHHHYDHIAGGKPFKALGARFLAHRNARTRLEEL